jgi:O-antigen/teichoic acid export membrane protein
MTYISPVDGRVIVRNSILNLVALAIPLVVLVLVLPTTIGGLGKARFGVLALAWVVTGYFVFLDLGIGRATSRYAAAALGRGEEGEIPAAVWTATAAQAVIGMVGAIVLAAVAPVLVESILRVPPALEAEATSVFHLLALALPPMILAASFRGVLEAAQRFDLVNALRLPASLSTALIPFLGVLRGWTLTSIVVGIVVAQVLALAGHVAVSLWVFPSLRRFRWERRRLRGLLSFGWWITVPTLIGPVFAYLDRFALGALISLAAVTYYAAPSDMLARLWFIPASLVSTLFPAFSRLQEENGHERIHRLVTRSFKYLLLVMGPLLILIAVNAHAILLLWLGPAFAERATRVVQVLAVGTLASFLAAVPFSLIQALGRADLVAKISVAQFLPYAVLVVLLVSAFGILGAAVAWTIRIIVNGALLLIAAARVAGMPFQAYLSERVPRGGGGLLLYAVATSLLGAVVEDVWVRITVMALSLVPLAYWMWRFVLEDGDRDALGAALRTRSER